MLLSNRMPSIPSSPRHSLTNIKEFQNSSISLTSPQISSSLQYFNMRVTNRLHRYRSIKRQWNEISSAIQIESYLNSKSEDEDSMPDIFPSTIQEYITTKAIMKEKTSIESDPLHSLIQRDLIKLRRLMKAQQKKFTETIPSKTIGDNSTYDDQEQRHIRILLSSKKSNKLNRVKISGSQMRPSTFPQTNSTDKSLNETNNSSSSCSQYSKQQQQQNINRIFNIYRNRVPHTLPSDSHIQGVPLPKRKLNTPPKTTPIISIKQSQSYRLPIPSMIKKKQTSFIKQETSLLPIRQLSIPEETTTCLYNYAGSTSTAIPQSMKLNRNTSLLSILLTSSSCIGVQPGKSQATDTSRILQDYQHSVNDLPKPIIPIVPRYDQGDYGILFEQLDHIRETMPDENVYEHYTRIC